MHFLEHTDAPAIGFSIDFVQTFFCASIISTTDRAQSSKTFASLKIVSKGRQLWQQLSANF